MAYVTGGLIENEHYNSFIRDVIEVWGDVHLSEISENPANFGYGQYHNLTPKTDGEIVTATDWDQLVRIVNIIANNQTSVIGTIPSIISPNTLINAIAAMSSAINTIRTNRLLIPSSKLFVQPVIGSALTSSFSGVWTGSAIHEFTATFKNWDEMRFYFNSGGQIRFSPTFSTVSSSSNDVAWVNLFNEITYIKFCHSDTHNVGSYVYSNAVGFYDLTNVPKTIYTRTINGMTFTITAWLVGSAGNTNAIQFKMDWNTGVGSSSGVITSNIDVAYMNTSTFSVVPPTFNTVTPLSSTVSNDPIVTLSALPSEVLERESQRERLPFPNPLSQITISNITALDFSNVAITDPEHLKLDINGVQVISNYVYDSAINLEVMVASNKFGTIKFYRDPSDRYNTTRNIEINSGDISANSVFSFIYSLNTKSGKTIDTVIDINVKNRMLSWKTDSQLIYSETNLILGENVGSSTAISADGTYVISGAPNGANGIGKVYMYKFHVDTYVKINDIPTPSGLAFDAAYGTSIACTSDASRIVVSAPLKVTNNIKSGSVFVFKNVGNDTWVQTTQILPPSQLALMEFGHSIDISDDGLWLVVGAPKEANSTGAVYVYRRDYDTDNWSFKKKFMSDAGTLTANDLGRQLGYTVSISGKDRYNPTLYAGYTIVAGKPFKQEATLPKIGAIEVYTNITGDFNFTQEIKNPIQTVSTTTVGSIFGYDADISTRGDYLVVGSPDYLSSNKVGVTHIYKKNSNGIFSLHTNTPSISPSTSGSTFGSSVSLGHDGRTIAIGAQHILDNGSGINSTSGGEVYVYHKSGLDTESNEMWELQTNFAAPLSETGHMYGNVSLASENNFLVVGAPLSELVSDSVTSNKGSLYVYSVGVNFSPSAITMPTQSSNKENLRDTYSLYFVGQFNANQVSGSVTESVSLDGVSYDITYDSISNDAIIYTNSGLLYVSKIIANSIDTKVRNWKFYPEYNITKGKNSVVVVMKYVLTSSTNTIEYTKNITVSPSKYATTALTLPSRIHNTIDYGVPTISGGFTKLIEGSNDTDAEFLTITNSDVRETWNVLTAYITGDVVRYNNKWYSAVQNVTGGSSPDLASSTVWVEINSGDSLVVYDARTANVFAPRYSVETSSTDLKMKISPKIGNVPQEFKFKFKCGTGTNLTGIQFSSANGVYPRTTSTGSQDGKEMGTWSPSTTYVSGDIVFASNGLTYKAGASGYGDNPALNSDSGVNNWSLYDYTSNIGFFGSDIQINRFIEHSNVPTINAGQTRYTLSLSGELPLEYVHHIELTGVFAGGTNTKTIYIGDRRLYRNHIRYNTTGSLTFNASTSYAVNDLVKQGEDYFSAKVSGLGAALGVPSYGNINWGLVYNSSRIDLTPTVQTNFIFAMTDISNRMVAGNLYEIKIVVRPLTGNFVAGYYGDQAGTIDKTTETTNKRVGYFGLTSYSAANTYTTGIAYPEKIMNGSRYNLYSIPAEFTYNKSSQKSTIVLEVEGNHAQSDLVALSLFGHFGEGVNPNSSAVINPNVISTKYGLTPNQIAAGVTAPNPYFPTNVYTSSAPYDINGEYYLNRVKNKMQLILKPRQASAKGTCNNNSTSSVGDDWANAMTDFEFIPYGTNGNTYTTWKWSNRHSANDKRFWGSLLPHNDPYTLRIYEDSSVYRLNSAKSFGTNTGNFKVGYSDMLSKNDVLNFTPTVKSSFYPAKVRDSIITEIVTHKDTTHEYFTIKIECENDKTFINEVDITGIFSGSSTSTTIKYDINRTLSNGASVGDGKPYLNRFYTIPKTHQESASYSKETFNDYQVWEFCINNSGNGLMIEGNNYTLDIKQSISGNEVSGQSEDTTILDSNCRYRSAILTSKGNDIIENEIFYDFKYSAQDAETYPLLTAPHKDTSYVFGMSLLPTHMVMPVVFTYGTGQLL